MALAVLGVAQRFHRPIRRLQKSDDFPITPQIFDGNQFVGVGPTSVAAGGDRRSRFIYHICLSSGSQRPVVCPKAAALTSIDASHKKRIGLNGWRW